MNPVMIVLGLTSIMICIGMILRAKVPFLRKLFVPVSVIAGILGFIFMNTVPNEYLWGATPDVFSNVVNIIFTISFICIALVDNSSGNPKPSKKEKKAAKKELKAELKSLSSEEKKARKKQLKEEKKAAKKANGGNGVMKGAFGMGLVWCALYSITPVVGYYLIKYIGEPFGMSPELGMLIPFGYCQGPGQAVTYGILFENEYGVPNSIQVAMVFAAVGFLSAFFVGVPLAKLAIKKKIAKYAGEVNPSVEKGIYPLEEQTESMGNITTHSGSLDTLAAHFAVIGVTYMLALLISWLFTFIPVIGNSFANMLFFCGMFAGYIVKAVMKKCKINHVINNGILNKFTGWTADYVVVMAFMAVELNAVGTLLVPCLIEAAVVTLVTFIICLYFGQRFGGENDLERTLGLYGTATGTTPSGVALIRVVDPNLQTTTGSELGLMNIVMLLTTPTMILVMLGMTGVMELEQALIGMLIFGIFCLFLLIPFGVWHKPTYKLRKGRISFGDESESTALADGLIDSAGVAASETINDKDFPGIVK